MWLPTPCSWARYKGWWHGAGKEKAEVSFTPASI
jgi:hypothetical protein